MSKHSVDTLDRMTAAEVTEFWQRFGEEISQDDDSAAGETLAMGLPIYARYRDTPPSHVIRTWPDGKRELLYIADDGSETLVNEAA
jgi:hypothetical protein